MLKLIIIYSYFVIFSGWIFNLLHLPPELAEIIIQALDVLPFLLVLFIFRLRSSMSILPNTTTFWIIIVLFIINSICTTVIHNGRILAAITHFLIMFRYMPLAVLLANRRISDHDEMLYIKHFKIISIILIIIGFIEIVGGPGVASYFTPVLDEFSSVNRLVDSNTESTIMPIFGVFPNTVDYSFFLLISYIIISNRPGSANFIWGIIYGILIYFTGSKATLLIFLLVISTASSSDFTRIETKYFPDLFIEMVHDLMTPSNFLCWFSFTNPVFGSLIFPSSMQMRLQRMARSSGASSTPMLAASSGPRPS